jgi:uncharacterized protein DUF2474
LTSGAPTSRWKQLAWFVAIWAASVAALALIAGLLRLWLG